MSQDIEREKEIAAGSRRAPSYQAPPAELVSTLTRDNEGWFAGVVEAFGAVRARGPAAAAAADRARERAGPRSRGGRCGGDAPGGERGLVRGGRRGVRRVDARRAAHADRGRLRA